jgi:hypothetical protein
VRPRVVDLVVADEDDRVAVPPAERAHAVVPAGQRGAVVQGDRRLGVVEGAVLEAGRHVQPDLAVAQVGDVVDERRPPRAVRGDVGAVDEPEERPAEHGPAGRGGGTPQHRTAIEIRHRRLLCRNPSILSADRHPRNHPLARSYSPVHPTAPDILDVRAVYTRVGVP